MNAASIAVLLAVAAAVFFAVRSWIKHGSGGCSGHCAGCSKHCAGRK